MDRITNSKWSFFVLTLIVVSIVPLFSGAKDLSQNTFTDEGLYIVYLADEPVARYRGTIAGFPATSPAVTGKRKIDFENSDTDSYRIYLSIKRDEIIPYFLTPSSTPNT